jgi:hypothetical protein
MAAYVFTPVAVAGGATVRFDTASGSTTPATIYPLDYAQPIPGALVRAHTISGNLPRIESDTATLYQKTLDYRGVTVTGTTTLTGTAAPTGDPTGGSAASQPFASALEMVKLYGFGHSYMLGQNVDSLTGFINRLGVRHRVASTTNSGVGGTRTDQILTAVKSGFPVGSRGAVGLIEVYNDVGQYGDTAGALTAAACFRAQLAHLTAGWSVTYTDGAFAFGTGWTTGATSTDGAYVDFAFTGDTAHVQVSCTTAAGGTLTGSGGQSLSVGGYKQNFTGVLTLSGYGAGDHVVRLTATGGSVTVVGAYFPTPTPPLVVWVKEAPSPGQTSAAKTLLTDTYLPALQTVANAFPSVLVVDLTAAGWNSATMIGPDSIHPNDVGHKFIADQIDAAIAGQPQRQGLNIVSWLTIPVYTGPFVTASGAGSPFTVADDYNRSNGAVGSTSVGALAYTTSGTWAIASNQLKATAAGQCVFTDANLDGTLRATNVTALNQGLILRGVDTSNFYIFYNDTTGYAIKKCTAGTYSALSASTVLGAAGDVLTFSASGNNLLGKVNGVTVCRATDSTHTGTRKGAVTFTANAIFDDLLWANNP